MNRFSSHTNTLSLAAEISGLKLEFPHGGNPLFEGLSLKIYQNEKILLLGPSGSGKSTLLKVLTGLIPNVIEVPVLWQKFSGFKQWGFVFQNPELQFVERSVREEVAFTLNQLHSSADRKKNHQRVQEVLQRYRLENVAEQNPFQLSTGQQRRLSVAATTIHQRKLLLLDEPAFGQDAVNTLAILEQLEICRRKGTAILMVTHNRHIVQRFATRQWQIKDSTFRSDQPGQRIENTKIRRDHAI